MSWRVKHITIKNFKFFNEEFTLKPEGRNVILYGENGAGKSSIYWSLYTHFQAILKSQAEASKYFTPQHSENLRNRYAQDTEDSYISVCFDNADGSECTYTDGLGNCYTSEEKSKEFMKATAFGSDFLNYKFLASLFDFKNSEPNEVFHIFEKHILPFLSLSGTLIKFGNVDTGSNNAAFWLDWLQTEVKNLPKNNHKTNTLATKSPEYIHFKRQVNLFDKLFRQELAAIVSDANVRLQNRFGFDVQLHVEYKNTMIFPKEGGRLIKPKLLLHAEMTCPKILDKSHIIHPKSFFNEAKITGMALAIRFAILNRRTPLEKAAGILVLDDLLISLDMSLRQIVLPMILEYSRIHQLFILTHDRSIFNMVRQHVIRQEGRKDKNGNRADYGSWEKDWYACELYVKETDKGPVPFFSKKKEYLDRAQAHFRAFNVPECANAPRQCCEAKLKELLGSNHRYAIDRESGELTDPTLSNYIQEFEKERKNKSFPDLFPSIDGDRQRILNPFSHDDIETPYYMGELRTALETMENLNKVKRVIPVPLEWIGDKSKTFSFALSYVTDNGLEHTASVKFYFKEIFDIWELKGAYYPGNPLVQVIWTGESSKKKKLTSLGTQEHRLHSVYLACYKSLSYNSHTAPIMLSELIDDSIGRVLENY